MTVEKFIRILGYAVYVILWSPVIVLGMIVLPIWFAIMFRSIKDALKIMAAALKAGCIHDKEFIETGVWH